VWRSPEYQIVGGRDAPGKGYWPWQLSLQFDADAPPEGESKPDDHEPRWRHTCGAVWVDENFALTAAHCVEGRMVGLNDSRREDPENFRLVLGAYNVSDVDDDDDVTKVYIDSIIKHERWAPDPYKGYQNDIALLRLTEPLDEADNAEMACIPRENDFNFTANPNCWITGWGKVDFRDSWIPDILQEANVEIPSNEWCLDVHLGYIRDTHICAGTGYPNACSGDSGGPMSCMAEDGTWYITGLASWTVSTCRGLPAVYTRVSKFWEWVDLQMLINRP
jgi:serine protease 33